MLLLSGARPGLRAQAAHAADDSARSDRTSPTQSTSITGASWLMGLTGTVRPSAVAQTATIAAGSNPVWEFDQASAYLTLLHRRNRFVLAADLSGFHSSDAATLASGEDATVTQRLHALTVTPGYAALHGERGSLAVLGGVRVWRMSQSVRVPARNLDDKARTSYYDVVLATRLERHLFSRMTANVYADAGGFGVASDVTWQLAATLVVRATEQWSLTSGYRHLSVDYRGDGKRVSLEMPGPWLGATIHY